jgi:hypothetical protein
MCKSALYWHGKLGTQSRGAADPSVAAALLPGVCAVEARRDPNSLVSKKFPLECRLTGPMPWDGRRTRHMLYCCVPV